MRWCSIASDACVPLRISVDIVLLVVTDRAPDAAGLVEVLLLDGTLVASDLFLAGLLLFGLGHADEPVESEGGENVEDAVCPEDTWVMLVIVLGM
jgi:hypothetical protein